MCNAGIFCHVRGDFIIRHGRVARGDKMAREHEKNMSEVEKIIYKNIKNHYENIQNNIFLIICLIRPLHYTLHQTLYSRPRLK